MISLDKIDWLNMLRLWSRLTIRHVKTQFQIFETFILFVKTVSLIFAIQTTLDQI